MSNDQGKSKTVQKRKFNKYKREDKIITIYINFIILWLKKPEIKAEHILGGPARSELRV